MSQPPIHTFPAFSGIAALCLSLIAPITNAGETIVRILVIEGAPGHSAIHLERDGEQLLWDPGGSYGTERDQCVERMDETFCRHFEGFPWEALKRARKHDVFQGSLADLDQMVAINHLESRITTRTYTLRFEGERGDRAWNLIRVGAELGNRSKFRTDRDPLFCTTAVGDYLHRLDERYAELDGIILPSTLEKRLQHLGIAPSTEHTPDDPEIVTYVSAIRRRAGLGPLSPGSELPQPN